MANEVLPGQETAFPESAVRSGKPANIDPGLADLPTCSPWDLKHHPENPRRHNLDKIKASLLRFGQKSPIIVQSSTGYVCKGNGTLKVIRDVLGWDKVAFSVQDMDDATALQYLLADNAASDSAQNDKKALAALLRKQDAQGTLESTLFSLDEFEDIVSEIGEMTIVDPGEFQGGYAETPEELAARQAALEARRGMLGGGQLKQVILPLKPDDYETFTLCVTKLSRAYGTKSVMETVVEAVRRAAEQVVA